MQGSESVISQYKPTSQFATEFHGSIIVWERIINTSIRTAYTRALNYALTAGLPTIGREAYCFRKPHPLPGRTTSNLLATPLILTVLSILTAVSSLAVVYPKVVLTVVFIPTVVYILTVVSSLSDYSPQHSPHSYFMLF